MKKTKDVRKITLHKETVRRLEEQTLDLDDTQVRGASAWNCSGPSCEIYRACTLAGWDC